MSEGLENQLKKLSIDTKVFENLETEFQEVIKELSGDASMERFRREFEKLHKSLKASHEREKECLNRCRELNEQIIAKTASVIFIPDFR